MVVDRGRIARDRPCRRRRAFPGRTASSTWPKRCSARRPAELVWHGADHVADADAVVLPGGFAHGDYLRPGAIARFSPVMEAVIGFARDGGPVIGICNGFQVLTEARTAARSAAEERRPEVLVRTRRDRGGDHRLVAHRCRAGRDVLRIPSITSRATTPVHPNPRSTSAIEDRIVPRYCRQPEWVDRRHRRNLQRGRNVVGLMPHPERAIDPAGHVDRRPASWKGLLTAAGAVLAGQRRS